MLAIRRLPHHPGPARWLMERIGGCNPVAVAWGLPTSFWCIGAEARLDVFVYFMLYFWR